jgi:restriction system protein
MRVIARDAARLHAAQQRENERVRKLRERQTRLDYLSGREAEADDENQSLAARILDLESILAVGLARSPAVMFSSLYLKADETNLPPSLKNISMPNKSDYEPAPLPVFARLFPGARAKQTAAEASLTAKYHLASVEYEKLTAERSAALARIEAEVLAHNRSIDTTKQSLEAGEPAAVKIYSELVLDNSPYPDGFPQDIRVGFVEESKQLVVDLRAPLMSDVVPEMEQFKYLKSKDTVVGTKRSDKARQALYSNAIAQVALRTLHELFEADTWEHIQVIVLNVYVITTDPGTGKVVQPYIVSIRVTRDEFVELQLASVDPMACLKRLKASVSRSVAELVPVKPIFDINMADPRFVKEQDVLSTLDTRPNLMALSPSEFESLITNLFQAMGLDTKLTQASRDGGVDCVAFDPRPVLGGKVIVQAKRYKNTVGVSAVRDLFGTVHNEGASKGILVTTSGFGKAAYSFANEKPLELITGSNLLYLLREHAGVDAKIEPSDDWVDPVLDIAD